MTLIKDDTADHGVLTPRRAAAIAACGAARCSARRRRSRPAESDSDFELNPSSELIDALQPDSGSDFELTALDASDEFEATPLQAERLRRDGGRSRTSRGSTCRGPATRGSTSRAARRLGPGPGRLDRAGPAQRRGDPDARPARQGRRRPSRRSPRSRSLADTPPPARQEGREGHLRRHRLRGRRPPRPTTTPTTRPSSSRPPATSTWRRATRGSEVFAIDEEDVDQNAATAMAPVGLRRGRGRGGRRVRGGRLQRDGDRLVVVGVDRAAPSGRRPGHGDLPRAPTPSGAASGSACSASPPSAHAPRLASSRSTWCGTSTSSATGDRGPRAGPQRSPVSSAV